ncbi:helix-turn-helix domain-containing protein [Bacillus sp. NPDC077027]|uniref:helix-turn-helix domain-containing protein n=1 Tax=Bacillus sp. NPDC077027 TaxID=3390548 RepID=UPI003D07B9D4
MKMNIGQIIKLYRYKLKLTQSELADGICSVSHLSKIENGSKEANQDTINLLLARLGISQETLSQKARHLLSLLDEFQVNMYFYALTQAEQNAEIIINHEEQFFSLDLGIQYHLSLFQYYLVTEQQSLALKTHRVLKKFEKTFIETEKETFDYLDGIHQIKNGQLEKGLKKLENCFSYSSVEQSDLYYNYAKALGKMGRFGDAIEASYKAMDLYRQRNNFKRIIHCTLIHGVILLELKAFQTSKEYLKEVILHTSLSQNHFIKMTAYYYYGVLLKREGDFSSAVPYLLDSLNYFNQEQLDDRYCETLYEIATLYAEYDRKKALPYIHELLKQPRIKPQCLYMIKIYKLMIENTPHDLKTYLIEAAIPYFENHALHDEFLFALKTLLAYAKSELSQSEYFNYTEKLLQHLHQFHPYHKKT